MKNFNDVCNEIRNLNVCGAVAGRTNYSATYLKNVILSRNTNHGIDFTSYVKDEINNYLANNDLDETTIPSWYADFSATDALYEEVFGWGIVAEWLNGYEDSGVFHIVGEDCFIERDGHTKLMKQKASNDFFDRICTTLSLKKDEDSDDCMTPHIDICDGNVRVARFYDDEMVLTRATPCLITKQDITLDLFSRFTGRCFVNNVVRENVKDCSMRKTNSLSITLKDGRAFKVIVKDLKDED